MKTQHVRHVAPKPASPIGICCMKPFPKLCLGFVHMKSQYLKEVTKCSLLYYGTQCMKLLLEFVQGLYI